MASTTSADGVLPELQRELDAFMATHAAALSGAASQSSARGEIASCGPLRAPLARLTWMATALATTRLCEATQFVLSWLAAVEGAGATAATKCASWVVAYLVGEMLDAHLRHTPSAPNAMPGAEQLVEHVLDRCVVVFQETFQSDAARAVESGGGFFAFKPVVSHLRAPTLDETLLESIALAWRHVLALVSLSSLAPLRMRLQKQLLPTLLQTKSPNGKDYLLLKNLSELRLGLDVTAFLWPSTAQQNVKEAAMLLKMLQPLTFKPYKPPTRSAAIAAIASLLNRELDALDAAGLQRLYVSSHGVTEWTTALSELHSVALKMSGKREYAVVAWDLRIALLCMAPNEIFSRYWKEDAHALLRVQYQQNKDGGGAGPHAAAVLECVKRCFTHILKRHFLNDRRIPGELDCMEIINTTQAWCFFAYPKQKSLHRLNGQVIPMLVQLSVGIASYNMLYSIQSHVRRLMLEADHIFDEKKLVGLKAMLAVCELCFKAGDAESEKTGDASLPLDRKILLANRSTLGDLVGQTLIEANALFGGDLLIESTTAQGSGSAIGVRTANLPASAANKLLRDEYRRAIAIQSYACALRSLKHLYAALQLSDDQKILILVRSCIHGEAVVRDCASEALHAVITGVSRQAGVVFRGVTDYIFRLSNHLTTPRDFDAFLVLIELTTSLLRAVMDPKQNNSSSITMPWESRKAKQESLLHIESVAVYLLVFEDARLLEAAVTALEVVAQARTAPFRKNDASAVEAATVERPSVVDVLRKAEWELREMLFSFDQAVVVDSLAAKDLGFFRQLIAELATNPRASFRWSSCLAVVFAQLATWNPEVAAFMWSDVNDKVTKLEPAMPSMLESDLLSGSFDLARWRNLAILATTTACPHLFYQANSHDEEDESVRSDTDEMKDCSVQSVISSSVVQALLKRLCRFLKSPSVDQKKAVILALGSTHVSSLPILMEVLQKYEPDAFMPVEPPPSSSRHGSLIDISPVVPIPMNGNVNGLGVRRVTKEQKARNLKATAQLQLQWALGRCYRLLLHTTQQRPLLFDDTTREAVLRLQTSAVNVIDKLATALSLVQHNRDAPQHFVFMMQQDFCSCIRALASLSDIIQSPYSSIRKRQTTTTSRTGSVKTSLRRSSVSTPLLWYQQHTCSSNEVTAKFELKQREAWYALLLSWCHSFSSLANARLSSNLLGSFFMFGSPAREHWMQRCDVFGERVDDTLIPWQWVDEGDATRAMGIQEAAMASFQRYFLCQAAFATLPVIVLGPLFLPTPVTQDAGVFRWLDECFAVEVSESGGRDEDRVSAHHFEILQAFCHRTLGAFLQSNFRVFVEVCVDKSFFSVSSGDKHNVAKHYFQALCDVARELKRVFPECTTAISASGTKEMTVQQRPSLRPATSPQNLQVRVCHVMLMHLGIESDAVQRQRATDLMNELYSNEHAGHEYEGASFRLNAVVSSGKRSNAAFGAQVMNRMQIAGASFLVRKLAPLSYQMSMSMLKFLSCCEPAQQKKMLVVVLPWLAEVSLVTTQKPSPSEIHSEPLNLPLVFDADQLLSLLFRITTNLGMSCSDQLEQAWLTLAFADPNPPDDESESPYRESNLTKVLQFLFLQRTTSVRLATAKLVVWWLCRWHNAAHEVLREALLLVETRRRESAAATGHPAGDIAVGPTIQPVDDVFVFVILLSDSCCHLASIPPYLYQHPALREAMMVQAVHFAFLALFALALDPRTFAVRRTVASRSGGSMEDHQQQSLYVDASNDCLVLLRNLLSQLHGPVELLAPIVDELAMWSRAWEEHATLSSADTRGPVPLRSQKFARELERAMASFAACLPPSLRNTWALECVKEISLALVPGSTLLQQTSSRCNNTQVLYCVRFGLLGYRVLTPEFHGDVFLTLLDLLHHSLDEHARDPANAGAVLAETLAALRSMVACMTPQKLVLYPQILWVCVALLNHGKSETLSFQTQIAELLVEILRMPHFATNQLLQDVLMAKKPSQWNDDQASVLRTLVWSLDRSSLTTQRLTVEMVSKFLVLPSPVFHANSIEHLMICTMVLTPFIVASTLHLDNQSSNVKASVVRDDDEDDEDDEDTSWTNSRWTNVDTLQQVVDLRFTWLAVGSEPLGEALSRIQNALSHGEESPEDDESGDKCRSFVGTFAVAFVAELVALGGSETASLVTMCFEILVKLLAAEDIRKRDMKKKYGDGNTLDTQDALVTATLWIVEAMVAELGCLKLVWRPTSVLLGSLARLVRTPEQTQTWQAAVRIMNCLGPSNRSTSASNAVRFHLPLSISTNSATPVAGRDGPSVTTTPPSCDSPSKPSNARVARDERSSASGAGTPGKKDASSGARKFMNLMGHRASGTSSNHSSPSHNQTNHTASPASERKQSAMAPNDPAEDRSSRRDL